MSGNDINIINVCINTHVAVSLLKGHASCSDCQVCQKCIDDYQLFSFRRFIFMLVCAAELHNKQMNWFHQVLSAEGPLYHGHIQQIGLEETDPAIVYIEELGEK